MKKLEISKQNKQDVDLPGLVLRVQKNVSQTVSEILGNVRDRGDAAILEYTEKFDGVKFEKPRVMYRDELENFCATLTESQLSEARRKAIEVANENVRWCASRTIPQSWSDTGPYGQIVGEAFSPFDRVACYVPQGSFPLVSTAVHTAAIADESGVSEIAMVTSPIEGDLNPAVAYAALVSGVTEIVFVGGAQGIAGVAFGSETIKPVEFICGPGNAYVAEAKRQLFGSVGIDMVAGPSEVFVVADQSADAIDVASDLVAQSEHGSGQECSVLLTDSQDLVDQVEKELESIKPKIKDNPGFFKVWENNLYLVLVDSIEVAFELTNECAPEHVEIQTRNSKLDAEKIENAGAVFVGKYSAEPLGDFVVGPSHVLPTNSTAKFSNGLSAVNFFRRTSVIELDEKSYDALSIYAKEFADMEGLTGHGLSSISRRKDLDEKENQ